MKIGLKVRFPYQKKHKKIRKKFRLEVNAKIISWYVSHSIGYIYAG